MKYLVLFLISLAAVAAEPKSEHPAHDLKPNETIKALEKTSPFCFIFDKKQNFIRCETGEIICYRFDKFEQCYAKPTAPLPQPTSTPEASKK